MTNEELEQNLKAVTDRLTLLDQVIKGAKIGAPVVTAFRCNHSGLYFPADYVKQWGRLYGHGLGPTPVSEVLDTDYETDPPPITNKIEDINQIMHPMGHVRVQMDLMNVPQDEYEAKKAIAHHEDKNMRRRAAIVRAKQLANPRGKLRMLQASWERIGR